MIRLIAELKCPKHPHYKAMRAPRGRWKDGYLMSPACPHCEDMWDTVRFIRLRSKRYTMQWSDKMWPRIGR